MTKNRCRRQEANAYMCSVLKSASSLSPHRSTEGRLLRVAQVEICYLVYHDKWWENGNHASYGIRMKTDYLGVPFCTVEVSLLFRVLKFQLRDTAERWMFLKLSSPQWLTLLSKSTRKSAQKGGGAPQFG